MWGSARNYFPLCALSCSYKDDFQAISVNFEIEFFFAIFDGEMPLFLFFKGERYIKSKFPHNQQNSLLTKRLSLVVLLLRPRLVFQNIWSPGPIRCTSGYEGLGETLHLTDENKDGGREWFCGGKSNCENISQNVFIGTLFISAFQAQDEQVEDRTVR